MCFVQKGDEPLRIGWFLKGAVVSSDSSVTTTMLGTRTSMLMISNVGYRHIGTYTCKATNEAGTEDSSATLRVNGTNGCRKRILRVLIDRHWYILPVYRFTIQCKYF